MAEFLTQEQISEYLEVFSMFDSDQDGLIDIIELEKILRSLGCNLSKEEIQERMTEIDADQNEVLDFSDFLLLIGRKIKENEAEEKILEICQVYDKNGNGYINEDQIRHLMTSVIEKLTDQEVNELIQIGYHDSDGSGEIDYREFVRLMKSRF